MAEGESSFVRVAFDRMNNNLLNFTIQAAKKGKSYSLPKTK
jgi:hypothetical protein